ncbi:MAG: hypothetical protein AB9869_10270 [Verrucomicrobiia bacterium]
MAKAELKGPVSLLSGTIGEFTYVSLKGRQVVRRKARPAKRSAGQGVQPKRIKEAAAYWRRLKNDPGKLAHYEVLPYEPSVGLYQRAVRDYCNPPAVTEIDIAAYSGEAGTPIRIEAVDDTKVAEVSVEILDMEGTVLEKGPAEFSANADRWIYTATQSVSSGQTVTVRATAKDLPGNTGSKDALAYVR